MEVLTVDVHHAIRYWTGVVLRVLVDGHDVTERCVSACPAQGWVVVFKLNADRTKYVDRSSGRPAMDLLSGAVQVVRGADA